MSMPRSNFPLPLLGCVVGLVGAVVLAVTGCSSQCSALADCCTEVDDSLDQMTCNDIAQAGNGTFCENKLAALVQIGACGPGKGTVITPPPDTPVTGTECDDLSACCFSLDSTFKAGCLMVVADQQPLACKSALMDLKGRGDCGGHIDAGPDGDVAGDVPQSDLPADLPVDAASDLPPDAGDGGDGPMSMDLGSDQSGDGSDMMSIDLGDGGMSIDAPDGGPADGGSDAGADLSPG
jgi:hypothetical protein